MFDDIYHGRALEVTYNVNGNRYNMGYYLTDGIYPKWASFMPAIRLPQIPEDELFTKAQEGVRKDVERAFGVLQARFAIIQQPALAWDEKILWNIMMACIIMHNMIIEDERDTFKNYRDSTQNYTDPTEFIQDRDEHVGGSSSGRESFTVRRGRFQNLTMDQFIQNRNAVWDNEIHYSLQKDLVQHIWSNCRDWYQ